MIVAPVTTQKRGLDEDSKVLLGALQAVTKTALGKRSGGVNEFRLPKSQVT